MSLLDKFLNRSELQKATDVIPHPPMPEIYKDWIYGDLPRLTEQEMNEFVNVVGGSNLLWLTFAETYSETNCYQVRGQYFMSPQGKINLDAYIARNKQ